jgi:hypothetical protein
MCSARENSPPSEVGTENDGAISILDAAIEESVDAEASVALDDEHAVAIIATPARRLKRRFRFFIRMMPMKVDESLVYRFNDTESNRVPKPRTQVSQRVLCTVPAQRMSQGEDSQIFRLGRRSEIERRKIRALFALCQYREDLAWVFVIGWVLVLDD